MSEIKWSGNRELQEKLKQLQAKSNKAAAGAITGLAFDVRQEVRNDLPKWLHLTRQFLPNSVIYERADETNLTARVGFDKRADFAMLLEEGGQRKPTNSRVIAVPTEDVRRTNAGGISKANRPSVLLQRKNVFSGVPESKPTDPAGIWRAVKKTGLKLLYVYKDSTRYTRKFLRFKETAEQVIKANHEKRFEEAIQRIIK